jgi:hypothetical protein
MNTNRDQDRTIFAWLSEGPAELADRVLDAALDEVHLTRQRPRLARPWRTERMTNLRTWAAAVAAIAVIAVGAALVALRPTGSSGVAGPRSSATSSAAASAGAAGPSALTGCNEVLVNGFEFGGLQACRYRSIAYDVPLSFGDPTGSWLVVLDYPRYLQLNARNAEADQDNQVGLGIATVDRLMNQPCQPGDTITKPGTTPFAPTGAGQGPTELFAWLASRKVPFTTPKPITIGGHTGLDATVRVPAGGMPGCPNFVYTTTVDSTPPLGQGFGEGNWRLIALDVNGKTIAIQAWAPPERLAAFQPFVDDLLNGLRFE